MRAAQEIADVHATIAATMAMHRKQQVTDFVTKRGAEAHATTLSNGASEEEAAKAAQQAARA
jgi:hypothetical protein